MYANDMLAKNPKVSQVQELPKAVLCGENDRVQDRLRFAGMERSSRSFSRKRVLGLIAFYGRSADLDLHIEEGEEESVSNSHTPCVDRISMKNVVVELEEDA